MSLSPFPLPPGLDADDVGPARLSPKHMRVRLHDAPQGAFAVKAALGPNSTGKTFLCADNFLELVALHPVTAPGFSESAPPLSFICGANFGGVIDGPINELRRAAPAGWIKREVLYGSNPAIEWGNGHRTLIYTAKIMNPNSGGRGLSAVFGWADEVQDRAYEGTWQNIFKRIRDRRAARPTLLLSGRAVKDSEICGLIRGKQGPTLVYEILRLEDNAHALHPGYLEMVRERMPASQFRVDAEGWEMVNDGAIYSMFSDRNIVDVPSVAELMSKPCHVGVDLRTHAAAVAAAEVVIDGVMRLVVFDQVMADRRSAEELAKEIVRRGWNLGPGSTFTHDPTSSVDEIRHFVDLTRGPWRGCSISGPPAGLREEEDGVLCVDRAICDGNGVCRLLMLRSLERDPSRRGVIASARGYDGGKHSPFAHAADALRYLVVRRLPIRPRGARLDPNQNLRVGT